METTTTTQQYDYEGEFINILITDPSTNPDWSQKISKEFLKSLLEQNWKVDANIDISESTCECGEFDWEPFDTCEKCTAWVASDRDLGEHYWIKPRFLINKYKSMIDQIRSGNYSRVSATVNVKGFDSNFVDYDDDSLFAKEPFIPLGSKRSRLTTSIDETKELCLLSSPVVEIEDLSVSIDKFYEIKRRKTQLDADIASTDLLSRSNSF